jgi:hexosaminidase
MLDVARHFFTVDEIKRYVDLISAYKLNRLHLHLADDQGWRIEIKSWANLTALSGATEVGGGSGGFYTQAQYADIVAYARDRFVTIVPEIDMPGHTNAALAAYAELNCDGVARQPYTGIEVGFSALCMEKEITYKFIDDVVREIAMMTPGPYFHVGGDEVKTLSADQYRTFIERVQGIVQSHGKQMVGWDEIAPINLLPTTLVQHWRPDGSPAAAVAKGAKVIMSVANRAYLDMKYDASTPLGLNWAGFIDVRTAYDWDPATVVPGITEASIAGVEAPIWTETLANMRDVELMAFPRLPAVAEVAWSPAARNWDQFRRRLAAQAPHWTALGVNFFRSPAIDW